MIEGFALINAGTIARGFGLQEIERVVVPVRVNLLLIGFEGEQDQQGLLQKSFLLPCPRGWLRSSRQRGDTLGTDPPVAPCQYVCLVEFDATV